MQFSSCECYADIYPKYWVELALSHISMFKLLALFDVNARIWSEFWHLKETAGAAELASSHCCLFQNITQRNTSEALLVADVYILGFVIMAAHMPQSPSRSVFLPPLTMRMTAVCSKTAFLY